MPPAKQLADELEVLEAVRAVTAIHAETVEDALTQVAEVVARAPLVRVRRRARGLDDQGEMRVGEAQPRLVAPGRPDRRSSITRGGGGPAGVPASDPGHGQRTPAWAGLPALQGVTALYAVEFGNPVFGVLCRGPRRHQPRGFTLLCRRLTRSVAEAAES